MPNIYVFTCSLPSYKCLGVFNKICLQVRPISHQAVFNTNAYIMLYELESPPFAQKSSTSVSKVKSSNTLIETKSISTNANASNVRSPKTLTNGVGFTSNKVYGPELPHSIKEKTANGTSSNLNGSSILDSPPTSSESDSDVDNNVILLPCKNSSPDTDKEAVISSTSVDFNQLPILSKKSSSPLSSPNVSTSISSLSSPEISPKDNKTPSSSVVNAQVTKSLVPYDSEDTTSSDDSNHSSDNKDSRVSTKAAIGE